MTDITKCNEIKCPKRYNCYRYMAKANVNYQSYFTVIDYKTCKEYWPMQEVIKTFDFQTELNRIVDKTIEENTYTVSIDVDDINPAELLLSAEDHLLSLPSMSKIIIKTNKDVCV